MHAAQMAVDSVPHDLSDEAANLLESIRSVELGHSKRGIVAVALVDQAPSLMDIRFSAASGYVRIRVHPLHQDFEVAGRQEEIQIELANEIEGARIDGLISGIEGVYDAGPDRAMTSIRAGDNRYP